MVFTTKCQLSKAGQQWGLASGFCPLATLSDEQALLHLQPLLGMEQ